MVIPACHPSYTRDSTVTQDSAEPHTDIKMRGHGTTFFGTISLDHDNCTSDGDETCCTGSRTEYHHNHTGLKVETLRVGLGLFMPFDDGDASDQDRSDDKAQKHE